MSKPKQAKPTREVFKVQSSIGAPRGARVLVYNESRTAMHECAIWPELKKLMRGRQKVFFFGEVIGTEIELDGEAPWQEW